LEADDTPVIHPVNLILHQAMESGANDIHIEPREKLFSGWWTKKI
jgi:type II secretory ATPase GspE/PulE/Tfp pilus assembly ATPase PilB-like protein